jgi:tetratricopeptide (TPR) repeat protein
LKKAGNELYLTGENHEATLKYNLGLEICPLCFKEDRAILLSNRAAASIKMGQKEKAIHDCTEALGLNPNYVKAILRRAQTYEDTDKPHESMKDFQQILEIDPGHKESRMAVMVTKTKKNPSSPYPRALY